MLNSRDQRWEKRFSVFVRLEEDVVAGFVENLSDEGALIQTTQKLFVGEDVLLVIDDKYRYTSNVRWFRKVVEGNPENKMIRYGLLHIVLDTAHQELMDEAQYNLYRRLSSRVQVSTPVKVMYQSHLMSMEALNVSPTGVFLKTNDSQPFDTGDVVHLDLIVSDNQGVLPLEATVVHMIDPGQAIKVGLSAGIGLKFTNLERDARRRLSEFMAR